MLVGYHLYCTDLQNQILWFLENQHNWIMSSFIPSSKSGIINMIFQNNYNQIMEITPSYSTYRSKFVTKFFSKNLLIWDLKLNFQRKPCKINKNILVYFLISPTVEMWSTHWDLLLSFLNPLHLYDSSNILWLIFEIIDAVGRQRVKGLT